MLLTSSVKELEAILQKLIKSEPGLVNNDDEKHLMTLMAMRMNLGPGTSVVGSVQQRNENCSFTRTRKNKEKESRFSLCLDG
jgi:hypothetical protein